MSERIWSQTDRVKVYDSPRLKLFSDTIVNSAGDTAEYTVADWGNSVFVIVERQADRHIALIRQHRYPIDSVQREIIAGGIPKGGDPISQAKAEVEQEISLIPSRLELLGKFYMQPSRAMNIGFVVRAQVDDTTSTPGITQQEDDESIIGVGFYDTEEVREMIVSGELSGAYCLAALTLHWQTPQVS